jgi:quinol monooxygenase YgiN
MEMKRLQVTARFANVSDGNREAFRHAAAEALAISSREPGVLQYDWFFNDGETVCVVRETFEDSNALLTHIANLGDRFAKLVDLGGGCELDLFGDPPSMGDPGAGVQRSVFRSRFQGK